MIVPFRKADRFDEVIDPLGPFGLRGIDLAQKEGELDVLKDVKYRDQVERLENESKHLVTERCNISVGKITGRCSVDQYRPR